MRTAPGLDGKDGISLSGSEWLFYGGIACAAAAAILAAITLTVLGISGKKLRRRLEEEYGKKRH